mmetsp:Transcript_33386/g.53677  ORF Transcript_33386/g.53677 Transcript_33386/m.53677 type:complete len:229 (-) Transcript_33386:1031-1717(-)
MSSRSTLLFSHRSFFLITASHSAICLFNSSRTLRAIARAWLAVLWIDRHFSPNRNDCIVIAEFTGSLLAQTITPVLEFPPRALERSFVSIESPNGTNFSLRLRASMHFFSANRPRLICTASLSLSPSTLLKFTCSAPPRSASISRLSTAAPVVSSTCLRRIIRSVCARDERSFIAVAARRFRASPCNRKSRSDWMLLTSCSTRPLRTNSRAATLLSDTTPISLRRSVT